jgi:hypothetical protein
MPEITIKVVIPVEDDLQVTQAGIQNLLIILDSGSRFACPE